MSYCLLGKMTDFIWNAQHIPGEMIGKPSVMKINDNVCLQSYLICCQSSIAVQN